MKNRRQKFLLRSAIVIVASASASHWTMAQVTPDEGPIVIGQRQEYEPFHLERPSLGLDVVSNFTWDKTTAGGATTDFHESAIRESLDMSTQGYILSPNVVDLTLQGSAGITESFDDLNGNSTQNLGEFYTWDTRGLFLRQSDAPVTLYSQREQTWINREFGPTLESITTTTGVATDLKSKTVPTHLEFSHLENTQTSLQGTPDLNYKRDAFYWTSSAQPGKDQFLLWNYSFANVNQSGQFGQQYQQQDATLTHNYRFGQDGNSALDSSIHYGDQTGLADNQQIRWDERLRIKHTDAFETRYEYTYDRFSFPSGDRQSNRGVVGFVHRLFQSLTTTANFTVQRVDFSGGDDTVDTQVDATTNYTKQVPLGTFNADIGYLWDRTRNDTAGTTTQVLNQPATFTDPAPIVLTGTNIDPSAIVITDPSGLVLYTPGLDYTVTKLGNRVQIDRVVGGRIASGTPVLLDYRLTPLPSNISKTNTIFGGVRYDIKESFLAGLGVYGRYTHSDQNISSSQQASFVPNSYEDIITGGDYKIGGFAFGYEHQLHNSTINPFNADRGFGRFNQRIDLDTTMTLGANYTTINYATPENHVKLFTTSAQLFHSFSRELTGQLTALYRHEKQDLTGHTNGFEQQVEIDWNHRQTKVYVIFRSSLLRTQSQDENFQFLQIGIHRDF